MNTQFRSSSGSKHSFLYSRLCSVLAAATLAACTASTPVTDASLSLSGQPLTGKFVWHDLITDDPAAAQSFYSGLFGWTFERADGIGDGNYMLIRSEGRFVGGMVQLDDPADADYSRWLPYLSVTDVDQAAAATAAAGGSEVAAPRDIANIARAAAVTDPEGAVLGLVRSAHGDPDDSRAPGQGMVVWNELLAANAGQAERFYTNLAGYQATSREHEGQQYIMLKSQGQDRANIMTRPNDQVKPQWIVHFGVADPAASAQKAAALGGTIVLQASPDIREGRLALVTDPTGALLALHQWLE